MMPNPYILVLIAIGLVAGGAKLYSMGKDNCQRAHEKAAMLQKEKDAAAVVDLTKSDVKREVKYVERIVKVREANDACLDQPMPATIVDALGGVQSGHGGTTKP